MNEEIQEFRGKKIKWVEVCCADCKNCIFNDDEYSEIFPLKCKISRIRLDFDTAERKRKIACNSYKPIASS
jgi:hypothetical protein